MQMDQAALKMNPEFTPTPSVQLLRDIIRANPDLEPLIDLDQMTEKTHLQQDMGLDSLALMSLLYELQARHYDISEESLDGWKTVAHVLASMEAGAK